MSAPREVLDRAREEFGRLSVPEAAREAALVYLERWLSEPGYLAWQAQILGLAEAGRWATLLDSFYQVLPFGTGGRRGTVGVGPNRFNPWSLGASVQGHATWLRRTRGDRPLSVVVAYDVREFRDVRGQMIPGLANPVLGMHSRHFAEIAAEIYAAADIAVHIPPPGSYLSTPELSFAIRMLGADAGLMVSASHNPPDDNGGKFYDGRGGQEVPPRDEEMAREVEAVAHIERMPWDRARAASLIREIGPEVHEAYIQVNLACGLDASARQGRIVFTALHGLGRQTVAEVLTRAGFDLHLEPTQKEYDGLFPAVPFRAPNPEVPASMEAACAYADTVDADLVMSCDPDADRLGVMVRHPLGAGGRWIFLSGNEIAALACHQVVSRGGRPHPLVVHTEVTSSLVTRVARAGGARTISHLLVGFKYIGDVLDHLDREGAFGEVRASLADFALGAEESHGLLLSPEVRDKDAAGGALVLAELASIERQRGRTLYDCLTELWRRVGYVGNTLRSVVMQGAEGKARIASMMERLRASPPGQIGGLTVTAVRDRQDPQGVFGPILSETDRASRNVLVFELGEEGRVILRPSGTEPKSKVYVERFGIRGADPLQERQRVDAEVEALAESFLLDALARVGLELPAWALRANDLLPIEQKRLLASEIVPELAEQLDSAEPELSGRWLRRRAAAFGRDGVRLITPALRAWAADQGQVGRLDEVLRVAFSPEGGSAAGPAPGASGR